MNVSLLGPTCAGKGTLARELHARFDLAPVATGDLLRFAVEQRTPAGRLAQTFLSRGDLAPDEIVLALVDDWVRLRGAEGLVFDGFPRTAGQATFIDWILEEKGHPLDLVVCLDVAPAQLLERAGSRQDAAIVTTRFETFRRTVGPVLRHYRATHRLAVVDGNRSVDEVRDEVAALLDALGRGERPHTNEMRTAAFEAGVVVDAGAPPLRSGTDVVLLGGPGSGKGTQAVRFAELLGVPHVSTGELFREAVESQTPLGSLAKRYMDEGELVPDDVTDAMVRERLHREDAEDGFILDGYPRTREQAEALDAILAEIGRRPAAAIYIDVSDDEIIGRLAARRRADDDRDTVMTRLRTFHGHNAPLLDYYRAAALLHEIDGEGPPARVTARAGPILASISPTR